MPMNCIIDDDKMSRKVIEEYVKRTDSLKLINVYSNAIDAINAITQSIEQFILFSRYRNARYGRH